VVSVSPSPVQADEALGKGDLQKGKGEIVITDVYRRNNIVTVKGYSTGCGDKCARLFVENGYLLDEERGVKYFVIKGENSGTLCTHSYTPTEGRKFWAKYTAPAAEIKEIDLILDKKEVEPIEGLKITDK